MPAGSSNVARLPGCLREARPPALRPAVATAHLKPGGFRTSPVQGRGARQRTGDQLVAHRSLGGARDAEAISAAAGVRLSAPTEYLAWHSSSARPPHASRHETVL